MKIKNYLMYWNEKHRFMNLEETRWRFSPAFLHFSYSNLVCPRLFDLPAGRLTLGERLRCSYNIHFMLLRGRLEGDMVSIAGEEPADYPSHPRFADTDW